MSDDEREKDATQLGLRGPASWFKALLHYRRHQGLWLVTLS